MSLTRTLTLLVTTAVLLIVLMAAAWSYFESNHELEELFDAELAQHTRVVQGLVRYLVETRSPAPLSHILEETFRASELGDTNDDLDEVLPGGQGHKYEKKIAFEVWSPQGEPLLDTLVTSEELELVPGYSWVESTGYSWRTFTLRDAVTGYWIRTAQREDIRSELSEDLAIGNVLPLLLALPLLAVAVVVSIRLSIRPLNRLEGSVRHMAPENIHPLDDRHAPQEVTGLVRAINGLLHRLDAALERERRFSADAAHELRTPLATLRLNLEQACERDPQQFDGLLQSVDRMAHLVEQMLLLSKVDAGVDSGSEVHDLAAILEQSIADVAPLALQKDIEPSLENQTRDAMIPCHSALISALLRSLLANAIQYSPVGTAIDTRLDAAGDGYRIRLCDHGPGIAPEDRAHALNRFVRLDQRQGLGAGLGLAIAQRIVELHDGTLSLEGRPDGRPGLCVEIWLPVRHGEPGSRGNS
jgi:two-component system sensor histidine kinase QseC